MDKFRKSGRLLSVNWQDGMLIKSLHFNEQEEYFENLNRWTVRNSAAFHGLARPVDMTGPSFNIRVDHDGQNWVVILSQCYAFTASGKIIQIDSEYDNGVKTTVVDAGGTGKIPVYVQATGEKVNIGAAAGSDMPTRYPYRGNDYKLIVGELVDLDPADCLKVGEIVYRDDSPMLSDEFIPPCTAIGAHPALSDYCFRIKGVLTQARQAALNGFKAFAAASQGKGAKFGPEHKSFQDILSMLSIKLGGALKVHPRPDLPLTPYSFFSYYQEIFGTVESMFETYSEAGNLMKKKYAGNELYNRYISGMTSFANSKYNHQEIGVMLKSLVLLANDFVEFINLITGLAGILPKTGKSLHYRQKDYQLQSYGTVATQPERDGISIKIKELNNAVARDVIISIKRELFGGADHRYIMVKIGLNENDVPGRMDPVYVDAETSTENLIFKPMDDLKSQSLNAVNLNLRGNFNPQALTALGADNLSVYIY
jgi:hypothetical protein